MDISVNHPLKVFLRRAQCRELLKYFQSWQFQWCDKQHQNPVPEHGGSLPQFDPPPPTVASGLHALLDATEHHFSTEAFRESIHRIFVRVGLTPDPDLGNAFRQYAGAIRRPF